MKVYNTVDGKDTLVLIGHQNPANRLWHVDLVHPTIYMANSIGDPTTSDLVAFAHSSLFSPVLSTLETALEIGYVTNCHGLTAKTLRKHPPKSIAMTKGHQDQTRKNQRSTKTPVATVIPNPETTATEPDEPFPAIIDARFHVIYSAVFGPTGQIYSNQTGRFISPYSVGRQGIKRTLKLVDSE
jgi:hypothetical protein